MNAEGRVTVIQGEDCEGTPVVVLQFPDVGIMVDPSMMNYADGKLTVGVPATIDLPLDAVVIDRWLPATREEAAIAVQNLDPLAIERVMLREQRENPGVPWGAIARTAIGLVLGGDTGIGDA